MCGRFGVLPRRAKIFGGAGGAWIVRKCVGMAGQEQERFRILFIEDDERLAALTSRYLELHGHQVTWIGDGRQGLGWPRRSRASTTW